eukprot:scaffold15327_cov58-Attheya_sp.AAC.2
MPVTRSQSSESSQAVNKMLGDAEGLLLGGPAILSADRSKKAEPDVTRGLDSPLFSFRSTNHIRTCHSQSVPIFSFAERNFNPRVPVTVRTVCQLPAAFDGLEWTVRASSIFSKLEGGGCLFTKQRSVGSDQTMATDLVNVERNRKKLKFPCSPRHIYNTKRFQSWVAIENCRNPLANA